MWAHHGRSLTRTTQRFHICSCHQVRNLGAQPYQLRVHQLPHIGSRLLFFLFGEEIRYQIWCQQPLQGWYHRIGLPLSLGAGLQVRPRVNYQEQFLAQGTIVLHGHLSSGRHLTPSQWKLERFKALRILNVMIFWAQPITVTLILVCIYYYSVF